AYAAIILIALLATWIAIVTIRLYFSRRTEHPKLEPFGRDFVLFAHSSLWASFFCIVSLLLTLRFSGRAEGGMDSHLSFMSNLMRLQLSVLAENDVIRLIVAYGKTVNTKFLLAVTLLGIAFFQVARVVSKRSKLAYRLKLRRLSGWQNRTA